MNEKQSDPKNLFEFYIIPEFLLEMGERTKKKKKKHAWKKRYKKTKMKQNWAMRKEKKVTTCSETGRCIKAENLQFLL